MALGISINIGLNEVDSEAYGGPMELVGAEADARSMADIARANDFEEPIVLLTKQAELKMVTDAIATAATRLGPGDLLLLSFSGHGAFVIDQNGDEVDGRDETWCLFDRELVDDCLYELWSRFREGVRILVVSDSCRSGTIAQFAQEKRALETQLATEGGAPLIRALSVEHAKRVYERHQFEYDRMQEECPSGRRVEIAASVLLLSACQDWEPAFEISQGVFTAALHAESKDGKFEGNYLRLHEAVYRRLQKGVPRQHPNYVKVGMPSADFELGRPFTI